MKERILIIEDNALNLELVSDLLEAHGYSVYPARTSEEGLRLAETVTPDLILMDLSLPGLDGLAATKALKAASTTSRVPVIALTAHAMRGDDQSALRAGCDGYLPKPIDTRTFPAKIAAFIATSGARSPSAKA